MGRTSGIITIDDRQGLRDAVARGDRAPFGWKPALVLVCISLVDRIETSVVAGVLPLLQEEWGFSDTFGGAIPTAAAIAGILVVLPAGYLADRVHRTRLLAIVVATWSVVIMVSGLAVSFAMFFATRVVLGAADSLDGPAASSVLADYYPPASRGKVFGYHRLSAFVGGGLGVLLGGVLGQLFGWRAAFVFMVVPGLVVAWATWRLAEPRRGQMDEIMAGLRGAGADGDEEPLDPDGVALAGDADVVVAQPLASGPRALLSQLRTLMRVRTVSHVYVGVMALFTGISGIFFWLPSYYQRTHDLNEGTAAALAAVLTLVATISGTVVGGSIGDRWHGTRPGGRIVLSGAGLLSGSFALAASFAMPGLGLQLVLLGAGMILMSLAIPNLSAAVADVLPATQRGIGFGLFGLLSAVGGAIGPLAVGATSDLIGSLAGAFYVLVVPIIIGSLAVLRCRSSFDADVAAVLDAAQRPE